jgi:hypothetical protein
MVEVEIDFRKSPQQNAEKFFKEAKRAKAKLTAAEAALAETERKLAELKAGIPPEKRKVKLPMKRRPRGRWYEAYRWMFTTEDFLVIGGRDARQNEQIFKKRLEPADIVLHADIAGAPLTVIKTAGREVTPLAIREAAELAAAYSRAWREGLGAIDVYWVKPEQVSKAAPPGEFLPRGAFMIRGKKNYLKKTELKIAIGVRFELEKKTMERTAKLICGNVQAVNKHAKYFVTLKPGDRPQAELAKQIKLKFLQKALPEDKPLIETIALEDIQRGIPVGRGSIVG